MKYLILLSLLSLSILSIGQEKKTELSPITVTEESSINSAEKRVLRAKINQINAEKEMSDAQNEMNSAVKSIYDVRKITNQDATLCEGPGAGDCQKAPMNRITLQKHESEKVEKEKVEKK